MTDSRMTLREFEIYRMGKILTAARMKRGMSVEDVASYLGIAPALYHQFEKGHRAVPSWQVRTICQYLLLPPAALFDVRPAPGDVATIAYLQSEVAMLRKVIEQGVASPCNRKHWRRDVYCVLAMDHPERDHADVDGFSWSRDGE
jgi:transcriptional regulator with XRE-family HTH domain